MELYQLEYFRTLCQYRSYTKTAQIFEVTQPAVTTAIKKLEAEFGVPIIDRTSKVLAPTPAGQKILQHADTIHNEAANIRAVAAEYAQNSRESVHVALPLTMCPDLLFRITGTFIPAHPEYSVRCSQSGPEVVAEGVESGLFDLGITCTDLLLPTLEAQPFRQVEFCVFFAKDHIFSHYDCVTPEMLSDQSLLLPQSPTGVSKSIHSYLKRHHIQPDCLDVGNIMPQDCCALAQDGKGVAILPKHTSKAQSAALYPPLYVELSIVWKKGISLTQARRALLRFLRSAPYASEQK